MLTAPIFHIIFFLPSFLSCVIIHLPQLLFSKHPVIASVIINFQAENPRSPGYILSYPRSRLYPSLFWYRSNHLFSCLLVSFKLEGFDISNDDIWYGHIVHLTVASGKKFSVQSAKVFLSCNIIQNSSAIGGVRKMYSCLGGGSSDFLSST